MSGTIGGGTAMAQLYELGRGRHWMAITTALVRLPDYLHSHFAPIDYERRRRWSMTTFCPSATGDVSAERPGHSRKRHKV